MVAPGPIRLRSCALVLLAWVAALAVAAPFDLAVSSAAAGRAVPFASFVRRWGELPGWIAVAWALSAVARRRPSPEARATLLLALLHPLAITQGLKHLWGRVRFDHLGPGGEGFTPFFVPAGPGAGESFPSGHVAMASVVLPVALHLGRTGRIAPALALGSSVVAVAAGRLLAGSHYLTDVVFSAGLGLVFAMGAAGRWAKTSVLTRS